MKFIPKIGFSSRFYYVGSTLGFLLILAAYSPVAVNVVKVLALLLFVLVIFDLALLYSNNKGFEVNRKLAKRFSNGDENKVVVVFKSLYNNSVKIRFVDELPIQFQIRDFEFNRIVKVNEKFDIEYSLRPVVRGEYFFGKIHVFVRNNIGLIERHLTFGDKATVAVYPSFHKLKQIEMLSFAEMKNLLGLKKVRHIGYNKEFEQVKDYVIGDEIKHINWKATARKSKLMVNQFQDEKSQHVYCMIDMGRTMKMPFNEMSLLDYSINASLALSQIILKNNDEAGLITYDKKVRSILPASKRGGQLNKMMEVLYAQKTSFDESTLEQTFAYVQSKIRQRSLLIFFMNFESIYSLKRYLPLLRKLSRSHLLLLVNYKNTEIENVANQRAKTIDEIYTKTISENFLFEKRIFLKELRKYGIYTLFAAPEDISIKTINKYLEIKAQGLL